MSIHHKHNLPYNPALKREEWKTFRKEAQFLETKHREVRVALRDAEAALRADPENENLQARVDELKKRLEEIERLAPWLSSEVPMEIQLWGICSFL